MSPYATLTAGRIWYAQNRPPTPDRPPLVLIHGAGGDHLHWPPELRRISGASVLALDLPGHGRSEGPGRRRIADYAADIVGFLEALGLTRVVLGGHSMGGAIAQVMALDHPERVAGLVLIGTGAKLRVAPALLDVILTDFESVLALMADWTFGPAAPAELKELGTKAMGETEPAVLHGDFTACDLFDIRDRLAEIRVPTLVIGGTDDKMTPLRFSRYLAEGIPGAQLEILEGAGHMMALEQPAAMASAVTEFMNRLLQG
jgi:pimeloyl-ACP methyl ester carboxylesterase